MKETIMAHNPQHVTKSESPHKPRHNDFLVCHSAMVHTDLYL